MNDKHARTHVRTYIGRDRENVHWTNDQYKCSSFFPSSNIFHFYFKLLWEKWNTYLDINKYIPRALHRKHLPCGFHAIAIAVLSFSFHHFHVCVTIRNRQRFVYARNENVETKMCFTTVYVKTQKKKRTEDEKTRNFITYSGSSQNETDVRACVRLYAKVGAYYWVKMSHRPISQCLISLIVIVIRTSTLFLKLIFYIKCIHFHHHFLYQDYSLNPPYLSCVIL